jgi:hypothetical protein
MDHWLCPLYAIVVMIWACFMLGMCVCVCMSVCVCVCVCLCVCVCMCVFTPSLYALYALYAIYVSNPPSIYAICYLCIYVSASLLEAEGSSPGAQVGGAGPRGGGDGEAAGMFVCVYVYVCMYVWTTRWRRQRGRR